MRLETIIRAWHMAEGREEMYKYFHAYFDDEEGAREHERSARQAAAFWRAIESRIEDYRDVYINHIAQDVKNYCAGDEAGYWPYRKRHAVAINELVAADVMELAQREPARWRFVQR